MAMVTLVAMNTRQIAAGRIGWATLGGFLISWLWWTNSAKDRPDFRGAGIVYGLGAGVGTALGFYIAEWLGKVR
jgi:hypothetical protein